MKRMSSRAQIAVATVAMLPVAVVVYFNLAYAWAAFIVWTMLYGTWRLFRNERREAYRDRLPEKIPDGVERSRYERAFNSIVNREWER